MLTPDHFSTFVDEVHGTGRVDGDGQQRMPFPWQADLLGRLIQDGRWPDIIDVPTGLGKTSVLDVAVFAAVMGLPCARRRVFFVVDRRLVVDEAHEHAKRIADALASPGQRLVTSEVARRLALPGDDPVVLDVTRMRGGATWERIWLDRPDRFAIIAGTVDQVGSRLLFRGYGVSERARSVDAALVGTDSLIIVDEAHLSQAFMITATSAVATDEHSIAPRPVVVSMSATTGADESSAVVHGITDADETHPLAGRRLRAPKRLHLVEVKTTKATADPDLPAAIARLAMTVAPGRVVGVVANTVARARAVYDLVKDGHDAVLLTGRSRQVDRDYVLHDYYPRMRVGRVRQAVNELIVVATQTVEVGANIDFDALITESAPFSSLVQRLGRLNRTAESPDTPHAIVVHESSVGIDDVVYGQARHATWRWLTQHAPAHRYTARLSPSDLDTGLDASPAALRDLQRRCSPDEVAEMRMAQPYVPLLHQGIVDSWARTSPAPMPDQPIEPFLHGLRDSPPPVTVVWREALNANPNTWVRQIDALPPAAEEGIEVSIGAVRRWLSRRDEEAGTTDLDLTTDTLETVASAESEKGAFVQVLRYRARGNSEIIPPWNVRPGDTIIVPTAIGGCDRFGWNPTSDTVVVDVSCLVHRRGRPVVRLDNTLVAAVSHWDSATSEHVQQLVALAKTHLAGERVTAARYRQYLQGIRNHLDEVGRLGTPFATVVLGLLGSRFVPTVVSSSDAKSEPDSEANERQVILRVLAGQLADDDTELGSSAIAARPLGLDAHQRAVADRAGEFARNLALPDHIIASVASAARWHDEGKRDPRFQVLLWNGDRASAELADESLAKSGMDPADRRAFLRARRAADYPQGMRHEALSAAIASQRVANDATIDRDLVVHLIASHHGHSRPLLPPITDPAPLKVDVDGVGIFDTAETMDWAQPHRFRQLNATYGKWGLALLETIVRLADIWCSIRNEGADEQTEEQ